MAGCCPEEEPNANLRLRRASDASRSASWDSPDTLQQQGARRREDTAVREVLVGPKVMAVRDSCDGRNRVRNDFGQGL